MATKERQGTPTLQHIHTLFSVGAVGGLTDGQLLEWYTNRTGEAAELAFATLVERHGPMVLRVCREVLRDEHEAHDAFQATAFLVLVRAWSRAPLGERLLTGSLASSGGPSCRLLRSLGQGSAEAARAQGGRDGSAVGEGSGSR